MKSITHMNGTRRYARVSVLVALVALVGTVANGGPATADVSSVGGGAFGAQVRGLINVGPLPSVTLPAAGGGPFVNSLATVNVPGTLRTGLLEVRTTGAVGATGFSESSAEVANVRVGTGVVTADAVSTQCRSDSSGSTGSTELVNARVGGILVDSNVAPNTTINLGALALVVLNEQIVNNSPTSTSITVNAARIVLFPSTPLLRQEVIIAQSRCSAGLVAATTTTTAAPTTTHAPPTTTVPPTTTTTHSPAFP